MEFTVKTFEELSGAEVYEILRIRSAVFVVEQNCVYQDVDGIDRVSLHMYLHEQDRITAYLRIFESEQFPGTYQIGRVLTVDRGIGLGGELLHKALIELVRRHQPNRIYLEAQCYAVGFYEREGFCICSEEFLEDGIPHVGMELLLSNASKE